LSNFIFLFSCFMVSIAVFGRSWCSVYLAGFKNIKLVTTGPFSISRNPLYLFSFIGMLGVAFSTETFTIPLITTIFFIFYYSAIIKSEEKRLSERFKDEFISYVNTVPKFIPKIRDIIFIIKSSSMPRKMKDSISTGIFKEENILEVSPRQIRTAIIDNIWFVVLLGFIRLLHSMQNIGILHPHIFVY
ncbi:MAG TPA: isoprenylcysteine carboxylmethyltransferase family protein, partial [Victivallales bacterium]|nr:isoprenylcysteine carboxylmethyltransferase family protein [Victivallales bacterium]